jgi:CopG family nickel-responsive transcriptional regulator
MERFTISLDDALAAEFDQLISKRGYDNRSEAVRDILRHHLDRLREAQGGGDGECVATLSYVYNHHERELAGRLLDLQHGRHDLIVSTMHAHLDHEHCIETMILKGAAKDVRRFADSVTAQRGVHHGAANLVMVEVSRPHSHGGGERHKHIKPSH